MISFLIRKMCCVYQYCLNACLHMKIDLGGKGNLSLLEQLVPLKRAIGGEAVASKRLSKANSRPIKNETTQSSANYASSRFISTTSSLQHSAQVLLHVNLGLPAKDSRDFLKNVYTFYYFCFKANHIYPDFKCIWEALHVLPEHHRSCFCSSFLSNHDEVWKLELWGWTNHVILFIQWFFFKSFRILLVKW